MMARTKEYNISEDSIVVEIINPFEVKRNYIEFS